MENRLTRSSPCIRQLYPLIGGMSIFLDKLLNHLSIHATAIGSPARLRLEPATATDVCVVLQRFQEDKLIARKGLLSVFQKLSEKVWIELGGKTTDEVYWTCEASRLSSAKTECAKLPKGRELEVCGGVSHNATKLYVKIQAACLIRVRSFAQCLSIRYCSRGKSHLLHLVLPTRPC